MADLTQTVIVELIIDDSQLQPALDKLESSGQIDAKMAAGFRQTTAELNKQAVAAKADNAAIAPLKKSLGELALMAKKAGGDFEKGFAEGVTDALKEAGVTMEEFTDALATGQTEVSGATENLRSRLKTLTQQIAELKLTGEDNTEQFREMVIEAGRIKDAIGDASQEIKNAGSDTSNLDNLIGTAQAVAGGFAVVQGAAALFGDESEDLQKTLLKVNAVMAIAQGFQQISNALEKEGAITKLANSVATKAQTVAQLAYNVVIGQSTGLLKALRIAFAATGIGLFVLGVVAAVNALKDFASSAEDARQEQLRLNQALQNSNNALAESNEIYVKALSTVKEGLEKDLKLAEARGDSELKLLAIKDRIAAEDAKIGKASLENLGLTRIGVERLQLQYDGLIGKLATLNDVAKDQQLGDNTERAAEAAGKLREQLQTQADAIKPLLDAGLTAVEQLESANEQSKLNAINRSKELKALRLKDLEDQLAALELALLKSEENSFEELKLKQKIVNQKARIELEGEGLTEKQKELIREKSFKEQIDLSKDRTKKLTEQGIQDQISRNNQELASVRTLNEDKLLLNISNIELAAELEVAAANGNANKIKEIYAKRDAEIAATTKTFIEERAQYEIDLATANAGEQNRLLQRVAGDERKTISLRISAIRELGRFELANIQTREDALEEEKRKRLISDEEYNRRYAQLQDDKKKVNEKTEQDITALQKAENEKRVALVFELTNNIISILDGLNKNRADRENQEIEAQRTRIQELRDAGAITEKEAELREKRLENQQRKVQREQAERDKKIAIFSAIVNTAQAVTKTLASYPFPLNAVLAAVTAGLGAAQIAVIANRPIPKFRTGKKNQYEGPGEIGEAGAELLQKDGQMYLAKSKSIVWLGKDDKVFTPKETEKMLQNSAVPGVDKEVMKWKPEKELINSEKFAATVAAAVASEIKKLPQHNFSFDEEGFKAWVQEGISRKNYMDKRYSSK